MKKLFILLCIIFIFSSAIPSVFANSPSDVSSEVIIQPYDYPVVKDGKWKNMTRNERLAACQLPDDMINKMSTDVLLNSVLNNPFMIDILAFDTYQEGFNKVYGEIPALQNLINRSDFSTAFTQNSKKYNSGISNKDIIKSIYAAILVAQPKIQSKINSADKAIITQSLGHNLVLYNNAREELAIPMYAASIFPQDVFTPKGTAVHVYNYSGETDYTATEKSVINTQQLAAYPNIQIVADPSRRYNCHSYAWYSTSTSNCIVMNNPSAYMTDGSYTKTTTLVAGYKAYWNSGAHSGIIQYVGQTYVKFKSKWGNAGVYIHLQNDCPYSGSVSIWKR